MVNQSIYFELYKFIVCLIVQTHKLKHRIVTLLKLESGNLELKILTVIKNSA